MAVRKRRLRRKVRRPYPIKSVNSLIKILDDHNFKQQLRATADNLGMSEKQVLTEILGR